MKKFINAPDSFVDECMEGILSAYPDFYEVNPEDHRAIVLKNNHHADHVSIVTGGGAGHLPLFMGYIGNGLCSGAAVGNVFSTPSAETIGWVAGHVPSDKGIVFVIGNYTGDIMNFEIAAAKAQSEGVQTRTVVVCDDVATAPKAEWRNRRCISGITLVYKVAGAAAHMGKTIDEVAEIADYANQNVASIGVAFSPCQLPDTKTPVFSIGEDEMEIGIGIHGETGVRRSKLMKSRDIAEYMTGKIMRDQSLEAGNRVAVMVNGLGATSQEELFILYRDIRECLAAGGIEIHVRYIGNYATSLGMNGASLSVMRLNETLAALLAYESYSPLARFH